MKTFELLFTAKNGEKDVDWDVLETLTSKSFVSFVQKELFKFDHELMVVDMKAYEVDVLGEHDVNVEVIHAYDESTKQFFSRFKFTDDNKYEYSYCLNHLTIKSIVEKMDMELNNLASIQLMSEIWGLSESRIKTMCQNGEIKAKKVGTTWVIAKTQPNPKKYGLDK